MRDRRDSSSALPCNDETCKFEAPVKHGASSDNQVAWRSFRWNTSRLLFMNLGITILLTIVFATLGPSDRIGMSGERSTCSSSFELCATLDLPSSEWTIEEALRRLSVRTRQERFAADSPAAWAGFLSVYKTYEVATDENVNDDLIHPVHTDVKSKPPPKPFVHTFYKLRSFVEEYQVNVIFALAITTAALGSLLLRVWQRKDRLPLTASTQQLLEQSNNVVTLLEEPSSTRSSSDHRVRTHDATALLRRTSLLLGLEVDTKGPCDKNVIYDDSVDHLVTSTNEDFWEVVSNCTAPKV